MELTKTLLLAANYIWIPPAFMQRQGRYRQFFFILAGAAIGQSLSFIFKLNMIQSPITVLTTGMMLFSFPEIKFRPVTRVLLLAGITTAFLTFQFLQYYYGSATIIILLTVSIPVLLLRRLIIEAAQTKSINLFTVVLLIYQLSILPRFYNALTYSRVGLDYYALSLYFEVGLGIFFTCFRETHKRLIIRLQV
jgi:magnesium-transporting ATPase (P-type)